MVRSGAFITKRDGVIFVEKTLKEMKLSNRDRTQAAINAEHAIHHLMYAFKEDTREYEIVIKKTPLFLDISIEAEGKLVDFDEDISCYDESEQEEIPFFGRSHELYEYKRTKGINTIKFTVQESEAKELIITMVAMLLGIVTGLLVRLFCGENVIEGLSYYGFSLFQEIFMNALKVIVGPVVFFSLCTCVARFKNISDLGRIGIKTLCLYILTTVVAIGIGLAIYSIHPVGSTEIATSISQTLKDDEVIEEFAEVNENTEAADFSIRNMITNIVPDNFFMPFINLSLLQIIFMGIFVGIGIGKSGKHTTFLVNLVEAINQLLMVITGIITKFIPIAVFCAMANLVIETGIAALKSILSFAVLVVCGMLIMVIFYCLFLLVTTGLNPFIFLKKFSTAITSAFATSSSTAIMPTSIKCCRDMGMDEKIVSFTIPFGANINMDGSSMVFILAVLFLSRIYGIELTGSMLISTIVSIIFLALGSPSVAGADLVIIAVLLKQVGIPMEAIGLILGVDAIFDMIQAVSNTTGDAVVSLVVSKSEKMLDIKKYNS